MISDLSIMARYNCKLLFLEIQGGHSVIEVLMKKSPLSPSTGKSLDAMDPASCY